MKRRVWLSAVGALLFMSYLDVIRSRLMVRIASRVDEALGERIYRAVLDLPLRGPPAGDGLQRRIEGPGVEGRKVLAVEDVNTTGSSVLTAVDALREAGAEVIGVAVIVDRGAGEAVRTAGLSYRAAYTLADLDLSA